MNKWILGLLILLMALLVLVHLLRLFFPFPVEIGGVAIPRWASGVFLAIGSLLLYYLVALFRTY